MLEYLYFGIFFVLAISVLLALFYKKYSLIGLLVLTVPINRFYIDLGFALRPFLIIILLGIFFEFSKALILNKDFSFKIKNLIKTNSTFYLMFLLVIFFFLSDVANGVSLDAIRVLLLLIITIIGVMFFYHITKDRQDLEKAINSVFWTGFVLAILGIFFYAIFLYFPSMLNKGKFFFVHQGGFFFEGVTFLETRPWEPANLIAVDISGGNYGTALIPFIVMSLAVLYKSTEKKMKIFAFIVFILLLLNQLLSFSRAAIFSTLFAFITIKFFLLGKSNHKRVMYVLFIALLIICAYPILSNLYYDYSELKGFPGIRTEDLDYQSAGRFPYILLALEAFLENPIFGIGHNRFWKEVTGKMAHNTYVDLLAEHGLLVTTLYVAVLFSTMKKGMNALSKLNKQDPLRTYLAFALSGLAGLMFASLGNNNIILFISWLQVGLVLSFDKIIRIEQIEKQK